ncbi:urea transporter [Sporosarcina sp. G11-34]|uniref:urea transporter n=1 Tax=Sporosarcina sp. G11-34 TaxID=2849605 RepID=UPI0022A9C5CD|nr:urea transporter [Sporosarcina sp. G11-34]MCZ2259910.1 urea transporter [Sporosarcina sp. G11-34]
MPQSAPNYQLFKRLYLLIAISLKGFSQVLLVGNTFSGCLILIGITLHSPALGVMAFLCSLVGTITGKYCGGDHSLIRNGIYSFNSILCGISTILFLHGDKRWFIALFAAGLAAISMKMLTKVLDKWNIPVLTIPFVFITWFGLLIAYRVDTLYMDPDFVISSPAMWNLPVEGTPTLLTGMIKGIGEVFIIDSLWTGSLILLALFWAGWRFGLYAIIGTFVSWLTAYFIGADTYSLNLGLYNYNAVLTIIAVSLVFDKKQRKTPITGIIAAMLTVPVTAGLELLLDPLGLPALTLPFILCSWLFIAMRKVFQKYKIKQKVPV